MDGVTSTTGRLQSISERPDRNKGCLRSDIASRYELTFGRRPRVDQLDGLEDVARYILRVRLFEGATQVHRTWAQMARGIGWPSTGTVAGDIKRYRNSIARRFDVLVEIGWLRDWTPVYKADGESVGILVTFTPAGVAQSVEPSAYGASRLSEIRQVSTPLRDHSSRAQASVVARGRQACARGRARAHEARRADRRAHELRCRQRGAALEELRSRASSGGIEALRRAAADGADPFAVALAAWHSLVPRHPRLTRRRWEHLERYCQLADRRGRQAGLGAWVLLGELEREADRVRSGEIGSLDYFVCRLRAEVRAARRRERDAKRSAAFTAAYNRLVGRTA